MSFCLSTGSHTDLPVVITAKNCHHIRWPRQMMIIKAWRHQFDQRDKKKQTCGVSKTGNLRVYCRVGDQDTDFGLTEAYVMFCFSVFRLFYLQIWSTRTTREEPDSGVFWQTYMYFKTCYVQNIHKEWQAQEHNQRWWCESYFQNINNRFTFFGSFLSLGPCPDWSAAPLLPGHWHMHPNSRQMSELTDTMQQSLGNSQYGPCLHLVTSCQDQNNI